MGGEKTRNNQTGVETYNMDESTGWRVPLLLSTSSDLKPRILYEQSSYTYEIGKMFMVPPPQAVNKPWKFSVKNK